jgi:hypothetical protein
MKAHRFTAVGGVNLEGGAAGMFFSFIARHSASRDALSSVCTQMKTTYSFIGSSWQM